MFEVLEWTQNLSLATLLKRRQSLLLSSCSPVISELIDLLSDILSLFSSLNVEILWRDIVSDGVEHIHVLCQWWSSSHIFSLTSVLVQAQHRRHTSQQREQRQTVKQHWCIHWVFLVKCWSCALFSVVMLNFVSIISLCITQFFAVHLLCLGSE